MELTTLHNNAIDGISLQAVYCIVTRAEESISQIVGKTVKLIPHVHVEEQNTGATLIKKDLQLRQIICAVTGFKWEKIISKSRKRELVNARFMYAFFAKDILSGVTLKTIGQTIGGRDHTTAIHAIQTVKDLIAAKDVSILDLTDKIKNKLIENESKAQ